MNEPSSRRRFVAAAGSIAVAAVAGCTELARDEDEPPEEAEEDEDETTADAESNGETGAADEDEPAEDEETYELTVLVETEDGEPAVGAFVTVTDEDGDLLDDEAEQPTDDEGQALFEVGDGEHTVEIDATEAEVGDGEFEETVSIDGDDEELTVTVEEGDDPAGEGAEGDAGDEDGA